MTARAQWKKFAQRRILLSRGLDGKGAMNPEASQDMTATLRPEPRATAIRSEKERGSSISAVHFEQSAHQGSAGCVSACQEVFVVRDRIELSTFRFSEVQSELGKSGVHNRRQPFYLHKQLAGAMTP
jgi:hypothetical protein